MNPDLRPGLYETLINEYIEKALIELCGFEATRKNLDKSESALVLSTYLQSIIKSVLNDFNEDERIARQVELTNRIITTLAAETKSHLKKYPCENNRGRFTVRSGVIHLLLYLEVFCIFIGYYIIVCGSAVCRLLV